MSQTTIDRGVDPSVITSVTHGEDLPIPTCSVVESRTLFDAAVHDEPNRGEASLIVPLQNGDIYIAGFVDDYSRQAYRLQDAKHAFVRGNAISVIVVDETDTDYVHEGGETYVPKSKVIGIFQPRP